MSFYIISLLKNCLIFVADRRAITWHKTRDKVDVEIIDDTEEKVTQLNSWTYLMGASSSILNDLLVEVIGAEISDCKIDLGRLIKDRFEFRRKLLRAAKRGEAKTQIWMTSQGLSREDIAPSFWKPDFFICGIDSLNCPFIIDFRDDFKFRIYKGPGTVVGCEREGDPQTNKWMEFVMRKFISVANNRFLYKLPEVFVKTFQMRLAAKIFSKVVKFIAKRDYRVSESCDIISIDQRGIYKKYATG